MLAERPGVGSVGPGLSWFDLSFSVSSSAFFWGRFIKKRQMPARQRCGRSEPKPIKRRATRSFRCHQRHGGLERRHFNHIPRSATAYGPARSAVEAAGKGVPFHETWMADEPNTQSPSHCCTNNPPSEFADRARSSNFAGCYRHLLRPTEHPQRSAGPSQRKKCKTKRVAKCGLGAVCFGEVLLCKAMPASSGIRPKRRSAS